MRAKRPPTAGAFKKGQSGNPAGKPKGSACHRLRLIDEFLEGHREEIFASVVQKAKDGDPTAMKICTDRIAPVRKGRPMEINMPTVTSVHDISGAIEKINSQMAAGVITTEEAYSIVAILENQRKAFETSDIELRMRALESRLPSGL